MNELSPHLTSPHPENTTYCTAWNMDSCNDSINHFRVWLYRSIGTPPMFLFVCKHLFFGIGRCGRQNVNGLLQFCTSYEYKLQKRLCTRNVLCPYIFFGEFLFNETLSMHQLTDLFDTVPSTTNYLLFKLNFMHS